MPYKDKVKTAEAMRRYRQRQKLIQPQLKELYERVTTPKEQQTPLDKDLGFLATSLSVVYTVLVEKLEFGVAMNVIQTSLVNIFQNMKDDKLHLAETVADEALFLERLLITIPEVPGKIKSQLQECQRIDSGIKASLADDAKYEKGVK